MSGIVLKRMGANTKATIDGINDRTALINQALPEGVHFEPYYDQSDLIKSAVTTVVEALILAFIFITVVYLLIRPLLTIIISILFVFIVFTYFIMLLTFLV